MVKTMFVKDYRLSGPGCVHEKYSFHTRVNLSLVVFQTRPNLKLKKHCVGVVNAKVRLMHTLVTIIYSIPRAATLTTKRLTCFRFPSTAVWGHESADTNTRNIWSMSLSGGIGHIRGGISVELVTNICSIP